MGILLFYNIINWLTLILLSLCLRPVKVYVLSQLLKAVVILQNSWRMQQRIGEQQMSVL